VTVWEIREELAQFIEACVSPERELGNPIEDGEVGQRQLGVRLVVQVAGPPIPSAF
jgi:hypothetical protein